MNSCRLLELLAFLHTLLLSSLMSFIPKNRTRKSKSISISCLHAHKHIRTRTHVHMHWRALSHGTTNCITHVRRAVIVIRAGIQIRDLCSTRTDSVAFGLCRILSGRQQSQCRPKRGRSEDGIPVRFERRLNETLVDVFGGLRGRRIRPFPSSTGTVLTSRTLRATRGQDVLIISAPDGW